MATGQPVKRVDGAAKVTGRARYTDDFSMPGMKHARYLRSPIAFGRVGRVNADRALAEPGVIAVFTYQDVPDILFATAGHPYSLDPEHADVADRRLLTDVVRYMGDEIAVVVAEDELTAARAVGLIEVEYEEYKPIVRYDDVLADGAPEVHPDSRNRVGEHAFTVGGELARAEAESEYLAESECNTTVVQHIHLENHSAYAYMDDTDHVVIVTSTQIPHIVRRVVSEALDFPLGRIRVVKPYLGGGFGAKQDVVLEPMAAWLTMKLGGVPVKVAHTREEGMVAGRVRHPMRLRLRGGADKDGHIRFLDLDAVSNTGAYASHGHSVVSAGTAKAHYLYPRAVYRNRARTIYGNFPAAGAMRAYGSPQVLFAIECLVEDLALAAGEDPVEFRLKNVARQGDRNQLSKKRILSCGLTECLEKGRALINWDEARAAIPKEQTGPVRRGLGVACFSYASGTYPVCVEIAGARLILNQDASVHLHVGATEIGQGADTVFAQMAAAEIGIPVESVYVVSTQDTDGTPFDTGAYASRQTYVGGQAVRKAAIELKRRILDHAAAMTNQSPDHLDIREGRIVFAGRPDLEAVSLGELALDAYYHKTRGGQITAEASYKTKTNAPSYGCTFVDLEVDVPLCKVKINRIINLHDAGQVVNPLTAEGQVHGGMAMGIGAALFEELLIDPETGRIYNNNLLDYKVPTMVDVPDLEAGFVETFEPTGPGGSKSLGEPPILSPPPAIRNAILHATGVAVNELPMNPKTLFRHFRAAGLI